LTRCFETAVDGYTAKPSGYEFSVMRAIYEILSVILRAADQPGGEQPGAQTINSSVQFSAILTYIRANCAENLKAQEVAKQYSLSYSYLSKLFKNVLHMSFKEYLLFLRIAKAERLLRDESLSISQIAVDTGFVYASYFIEQFKRVKGETPGAYRSFFGGRQIT